MRPVNRKERPPSETFALPKCGCPTSALASDRPHSWPNDFARGWGSAVPGHRRPGCRRAGSVGYEQTMPPNQNLREFIDQLQKEGYTVQGSKDEDPVLIAPDGSAVATWREDYPYDELMDREVYEQEKYHLQVELLKFQYWSEDVEAKHVLVFEGRDAAGKGGTIKRFMEHLNPRAARVVALTKPTSTEQGEWYFQRYVGASPPRGRSCCSTVPGTTGPGSSG